jgi:hypothetical protein
MLLVRLKQVVLSSADLRDIGQGPSCIALRKLLLKLKRPATSPARVTRSNAFPYRESERKFARRQTIGAVGELLSDGVGTEFSPQFSTRPRRMQSRMPRIQLWSRFPKEQKTRRVYCATATSISPVALLTFAAPHSVGLPLASNLQPK